MVEEDKELEDTRLIVRVERAENGFLLFRYDSNTPQVFELRDEDYDETKCKFAEQKVCMELLYAILDTLGVTQSKHEPFRIEVRVKDQREPTA